METNEQESALNEIRVKLQELAEEYRQAIELTQSTELRELFGQLQRERDKLADMLLPHIRKVGLPRDADPEHVGLRTVFEKFKATLSPEKDASLAHDLHESENELANIIASSHQRGVPAASVPDLNSAESSATRARKELSKYTD